jgi:hypothetical protein
MNTFKHSGKLGDIIYSLPAVRALGGGTMLLNPNRLVDLSIDAANSLLPLLASQDYIEDARLWRGEGISVDLDGFRFHLGYPNLALCHLAACGVSKDALQGPWLSVEPNEHEGAVFSRSLVRHGVEQLWPLCRRLFPEAVFVGTADEHRGFEAQFGAIEFRHTGNLLDLGRTLAACTVFVGNQSCPYAIAEGLQIRSILEVAPMEPNCNFGRSDAIQVTRLEDLDDLPRIVESWRLLSAGNPMEEGCDMSQVP